MLVKSVQLGLSRCAGRLPMAETPKREASSPPQRPFRAISGPPPDGCRATGVSALPGHLRVPLRGAQS
eukprot:2101554-Alexandrium_andersonii.AAC.1